jgi:predicted  nucleic acid-binding Zn-ribbon protein
MKHFCAKCGKPTIYALALPKFCSQCGSEFSLVTKEKDKSVHDRALEKAKEKYPRYVPETVPVTKAEPKNYPNPARASIKYKLVDDDDTTYSDEEDEYLQDIDRDVNPDLFANIKPKFRLQQFNNTSESFENLITQSYASNYKPIDPNEMRQGLGGLPLKSANDVLEEFKREAGSTRNQQD